MKLGQAWDGERHPGPSPGGARQDQSQGSPVEGGGGEAGTRSSTSLRMPRSQACPEGPGPFTGECLCVTVKYR